MRKAFQPGRGLRAAAARRASGAWKKSHSVARFRHRTGRRAQSAAASAALAAAGSGPPAPSAAVKATARRYRRASVLAGLAALEEVAPVVGGDVDVERAGGRPDALPGLVPLGVGHALDLVEAGDGVADVGGVGERLLALVGEGEGAVGHPVLLGRAQALGLPGDVL